ncbi:creatininase family protein [Brevibacillus panacihumi]|uniref:Creatininase family protein n=1 Tax=Brevibacillus panacihumi TaxID=497735 RepID=A0A3M8CJ77_9BACL|nr:creatininase family protein [Brevibacillus panacihumi]RNB75689.1 creatininase family protein [Brevibacillus panacihumi]
MNKYLFAEMTWPEIQQVIREERVAVVPVAMIEEHGHHLPVDTDLVLANEVCVRAAQKSPADMVVIPPINHGYAPHQMDFPGVISISSATFISYVTDVCRSLAHQGFKRILLLNGHGSNVSLLQVVARQTILEYPEVMCASISHWDLQPLIEMAEEIRESENPGGMNHACELETSMYLAIKEDLVQMDKAVRDLDKFKNSKYFWLDLVGKGEGRPVVMMPYWSAISETGTLGDPTVATREKGEKLLAAAVDGLVEFIQIFKEREHHPRVNHHQL